MSEANLVPLAGSADDEHYEKFVQSMVPHCRCAERHRPCDGVLACGICDDMQDDESNRWEEDDEY